jgi:hypothetical protein
MEDAITLAVRLTFSRKDYNRAMGMLMQEGIPQVHMTEDKVAGDTPPVEVNMSLLDEEQAPLMCAGLMGAMIVVQNPE